MMARLDLSDNDARDAMATRALRRGDMRTLQLLADADPALGRRVARRLIDGGGIWDALPPTIDGPSGRGLPFPGCLRGAISALAVRCGIVVRVSWDDREQRLFACDCAERVLPIFERAHPGDLRTREAIRVARAYARDDVGGEELDAAGDAAWGAARFAARFAAWGADRTADAARNAAVAVAGDAECAWQRERLLAYLLGEVEP